jgi:streptogramin lyase
VFELETIIGFVGLNASMLLLLFVARRLKCPRRMLWLRGLGLVASVAFLIGLLIAPVSAAVITEYWYGPGPARPWEVACDVSANRAFYTAQMSNRIGLVEWGSGKFTEWTIPTSGGNPWGITLGPEISTDTGTFAWFTESVGSKIGRLNPITGEIVEWAVTAGSEPHDIAIDRTRLIVWFTEYMTTGGSYKIGKLTYVSGVGWRMTEYPVPSGIANPSHITVDNEGIVWFTAYGSSAVVRFNPFKGEFTTYQVPSAPKGITFDKDGFIWFTSSGPVNSICRLNWWKNETIYWQIPTSGCDPSEIVIDQDFNVWFTEFATAKIGKFVPGTGDFYEYPTPTAGSQPYGICIQSSDTIVFTEPQANRLGRVFQPAWMAGGVDTVTTAVNWVSHASTMTTTGTTTSATTTITSTAPTATSTIFTTSTQTQWSTTGSTITETKSILYTSSTTTRTETSTTTTVSTTTTSVTTSKTSTTTETSTTTTTTSTTSTSTTVEVSSSTMTVTYPTTTYFPTITSITVASWTSTSTSSSVTTTQTSTSSTQTLVVTSFTTVTSTPTARRCIIASAAYGSELAPQVQFLRIFRDNSLEATFAGHAFMETFNAFYYSFSPAVANYVAQNSTLQAMTRLLIYPLISTLGSMSAIFGTLGFASELAAVASGVAASALVGTIYVTPVLALASILSRKLSRRY